MTLLMRVLSLCLPLYLSPSVSVSTYVYFCFSFFCLCLRLFLRSGCIGRWRLPCSTNLSPAVSPGMRVLEAWDVVVLVAVDIAVVGLFFLLLIFVVLLFTEPSIDAIVACCRRRYVDSLSLSLLRPLPSCALTSVLSWPGHVLGDGASRVLSIQLLLCLSLSLAVSASASVFVLVSISRPLSVDLSLPLSLSPR